MADKVWLIRIGKVGTPHGGQYSPNLVVKRSSQATANMSAIRFGLLR